MFSALVSLQVAFSSGSSNASPFQVMTSYSNSEVPVSTITWTSTVRQVLYSNSFPVTPPARRFGCELAYDDFNATAGPVSGTMTASSPVDFYLVSEENFNEWASLSTAMCTGPITALPGIRSSTSYSFTANLPQSGEYFLLFINFSKTSTANVFVVVNSVGSPVTYTTTSDSLYVQAILVTEALSQLSSTPSALASTATQSSSLGAYPIFEIAVVGVILIFIVGALLYYVREGRKELTKNRKQKGSKKKSVATASLITPRERARTATEPRKAIPEKQFCLECGAQVPTGSKFCNKCGAEQRTL